MNFLNWWGIAQKTSDYILVTIWSTIRIQEFLKGIYSRLYKVSCICQVAALVWVEVCALQALLVIYMISASIKFEDR